jgi:polyisoprenoid-binding protein YceI
MLKTFVLALAALLVSGNALAQWDLVNAESTLNYVTIKSDKVAELNHFRTLNGSIDDGGNVSINIDLGSVETNVPVRNDRMKSMLFEITSFPSANIKSSVDPAKIASMKAGDTYIDSISLELSLHGVSVQLVADVRIVKLSGNKLLAASVKPVLISADEYHLAAGVEKLREVAKLPSISTAVPVTFSIIFKQ